MTYSISEAQWQLINSALLTAAGACTVHAPDVRDQMIKASMVMDDIVEASELAETKPLSTYPEDREKLLGLCSKAGDGSLTAAIELSELVKSILDDEAA